jgi:hypothetical protein
MYFDHEKLIVYQKSLGFIEFVESIIQRFKYHMPVIEHLDEASTSVSLNIAEGRGNLPQKINVNFLIFQEGRYLVYENNIDYNSASESN